MSRKRMNQHCLCIDVYSMSSPRRPSCINDPMCGWSRGWRAANNLLHAAPFAPDVGHTIPLPGGVIFVYETKENAVADKRNVGNCAGLIPWEPREALIAHNAS